MFKTIIPILVDRLTLDITSAWVISTLITLQLPKTSSLTSKADSKTLNRTKGLPRLNMKVIISNSVSNLCLRLLLRLVISVLHHKNQKYAHTVIDLQPVLKIKLASYLVARLPDLINL